MVETVFGVRQHPSQPDESKKFPDRGGLLLRWKLHGADKSAFYSPKFIRRFLCQPHASNSVFRQAETSEVRDVVVKSWHHDTLATEGEDANLADRAPEGPSWVLDVSSEGPNGVANGVDASGRIYSRFWNSITRTFHSRPHQERAFLFDLYPNTGSFEPIRFLVGLIDGDERFHFRPHVPLLSSAADGTYEIVFPALQSISESEDAVACTVKPGKVADAEWKNKYKRIRVHHLKDLELAVSYPLEFRTIPRSRKVRFGALDCTVSKLAKPYRAQTHAHFVFGYGKTVGVKHQFTDLELISYSIGLRPSAAEGEAPDVLPFPIPLNDVAPGGAGRGDDVSGLISHGEQPFLVPIERPGQPGEFVMEVVDENSRDHRQRLILSIKKLSATSRISGNEKIFYLDRNPFLVALLSVSALRNFRPGTGNEIAYWSTEGPFRGWQLKATVDNFDLTLPPQVLAEEMEKRIGSSDIGPGELVDFRFTTPAKLTLRSGELIRNYGIVPWDLEFYLNGLRESRLVGLPLERAEFELLYGIRTRLDNNTRLRLAEIFTRLGFPASRLPDTPRDPEFLPLKSEYTKYQKLWDRYLAALENRLAIYELFEEDQQEFNETGERVGLEISGRRNEDGPQAYIVANRTRDDATTGSPEYSVSFDSSQTRLPIPVYEEGLAGSFAWAFESRLLFEALYNDPDPSTHMRVEAVEVSLARLYFSALGGWGTQEAAFDNGKARVQVTVEMGRVSEMRVERIGRVGVFWNKAKMVTVFRRTVAPTKQFEMEQDPHLGRPILRKVEEYIEFIEKHRRHPDLDTEKEDGRLAGCLVGSSCEEKILMNSRWGVEVFADDEEARPLGWKVPFRIPTADREVYRPANVYLHFPSHPGSPDPETTARIENLEDLWFWTDLNPETTDNTDSWDPQPYIDFGPFARAPKEARPMDGGRPLWGTAPIPPAAGRFTFRLGELERGINLAAHQQRERPPEDRIDVSARLRHFTMTRGEAPPPREELKGASLADQKMVLEAANKARPIGRLREEVEGIASLLEQLPLTRLQKLGDPDRTEVAKAITGVKEYLEKGLAGPAKALNPFDQAQGALEELKGKLGGGGNPLAKDELKKKLCGKVKGSMLWQLRQAERHIAAIPRSFLEYSNDVVREIDGLADERIEEARRLGQSYLRSLRERSRIDRLQGTLHGQIDKLLIVLRGPVDGQQGGAMKDLADIKAKVASLQKDLGSLNAPDIQKKLRAIALLVDSRLVRELNERISALRQMPHKLDVTPIQTLVDLGLAKVEPGLEKAKDKVAEVRASVKQALEKLLAADGPIVQVESSLGAAVAALKKTKADATLSKKLNQLESWADGKIAEIGKLKNEQLKAGVKNILGEANASLDAFEAEVRTLLDKEGKTAAKEAEKLCMDLVGSIYDSTLGPVVGQVQAVLDSFKDDLDLLGQHYETAKEIHEWVDSRRRVLKSALNGIPDAAERALDATEDVLQRPGKALKALRGVGSDPEAALLAFKGMTDFSHLETGLNKSLKALDRQMKSVGYVFGDTAEALGMTPITAMVDNAESYLGDRYDEIKMKAAELAVPVNRLGKQLEADLESIKKEAKDTLFKGMAGMKKFLRGLVDDDLAKRIEEATTIETKTDPKTMTGFVDAKICNLRLGSDSTIFSFGPIALRLRKPVLEAHARMERTRDGSINRTSTGKIIADWEMSLQGQKLLMFRQTEVVCKDGKVKVDLDPSKLELSSVMQALADMAQTYETEDDGFRYGLIQDLPKKIEAFCELNIKLPPVEAGTFAVTNLSFGAFLRIRLGAKDDPDNASLPDLKTTELSIASGLNLANEKAPFSIIVFILGGCGWFEVSAKYSIGLSNDQTSLTIDVSIAIGAAAFLGINLGFLRGSVMVSLAVEVKASLIKQSNGQNSRTVRWSIVLTFSGRCSVIGLISVSLTIVLAIRYSSGGGMTGTGRVSISIRICWCVKIKVERSFTYRFKKAKGGTARVNGAPARLADPRMRVPSQHDALLARLQGKEIREAELVERKPAARKRPNRFSMLG